MRIRFYLHLHFSCDFVLRFQFHSRFAIEFPRLFDKTLDRSTSFLLDISIFSSRNLRTIVIAKVEVPFSKEVHRFVGKISNFPSSSSGPLTFSETRSLLRVNSITQMDFSCRITQGHERFVASASNNGPDFHFFSGSTVSRSDPRSSARE